MTVVLSTAEGSQGALAPAAQDALAGAPVRLDVVAPEEIDGQWLARIRPALVIFHLTDDASAARAQALVAAAAALPHLGKVIAVGESGLAAHGLALLRAGAAEYLERPVDLRRLALLVEVLTVRARLLAAEARGRHPAAEGAREAAPVADAALERVMDQVRRVAPVSTNVLIQGETGTGKSRLARVIHDLSPRRDKPFLVVNCAALSTSLVESELFGHVRGAFTGADRDRAGKFAEAGGGTIFLDEVDSLPVEVQAKLLRVVEDRVYEPVGSNVSQPMGARLITASNKSLDRESGAGRFRADLLFRLNVVTFQLPSLRERRGELPGLIDQFVREFAENGERSITGVTPEARAALLAHAWPGNIRELRNAVERAVALRPGGEIQLEDLPDALRAGARPRPAAPAGPDETAEAAALTATAAMPTLPCEAGKGTLAERKAAAEADLIRDVLRKNRNNRARTAAELGISRETLYKKLHRYGLFHAVA